MEYPQTYLDKIAKMADNERTDEFMKEYRMLTRIFMRDHLIGQAPLSIIILEDATSNPTGTKS